MEIETGEYHGIMHMVADKLMEAFEGGDAINYIEQTFEDKENPERCFVLTMQMKEGLTPCQKLATAEERIKELEARNTELKVAMDDLIILANELTEQESQPVTALDEAIAVFNKETK